MDKGSLKLYTDPYIVRYQMACKRNIKISTLHLKKISAFIMNSTVMPTKNTVLCLARYSGILVSTYELVLLKFNVHCMVD